MAICQNCGTEQRPGARFCGVCGAQATSPGVKGAPVPLQKEGIVAADAVAPAPVRAATFWILAVSVLALVVAAGTLTVVLVVDDDADPSSDEGQGVGGGTVPASSIPPAGVPPSRRLSPLSVSASSFSSDSQDRCSNPVSYGPANTVDGRAVTAWQVSGDGTGQRITFTFPAGTTVTRVGLVAGYDKVDPCDGTDRFTQNHRILSVFWQLAPGAAVTQSLDIDDRNLQHLDVEPVATRSVTLQIQGVRLGDPSGDTAISEISVVGYRTG